MKSDEKNRETEVLTEETQLRNLGQEGTRPWKHEAQGLVLEQKTGALGGGTGIAKWSKVKVEWTGEMSPGIRFCDKDNNNNNNQESAVTEEDEYHHSWKVALDNNVFLVLTSTAL